MPRKSGLMDQRQSEIGSRIKQLREELQFSQPGFARVLEITLDQIASIEYGRTPLRYSLGDWVCARFDVNQRWVAEGKQPKYFYIQVPAQYLRSRSPNALFSDIYTRELKAFVEAELARVAKFLNTSVERIEAQDAHIVNLGGIQYRSVETFQLLLSKMMESLTPSIPPHLYQDFYSVIGKSVRDFVKKHKREIESHGAKK